MSDQATRTAKRQGDHAAELAAEVRAGRPERTRLRAYCGCLAARFVLGWPTLPAHIAQSGWATWSPGNPPRWRRHDKADRPLPAWLAGLARLAWAPPLSVPCSQFMVGVAQASAHGLCPEYRGNLKRPANVDPAHWVLAVAACGVARATHRHPSLSCCEGGSLSDCEVLDAIEAAEGWTRCPCTNCLHVWHERCANADQDWLLDPLWVAGDWVDTFNAATQIIGPDAVREAAAQSVLKCI